jgi:hypothetical protein
MTREIGDQIEVEPLVIIESDAEAHRRQAENLGAGRRDRYGADPDPRVGLQTHIQGCRAERAFCEWSGIAWSGKYVLGGPDVGGFEIRGTHRHRGRLIVHPEDPDHGRYVLVTGEGPVFWIRGWILGRDAKRPRWFGHHGNPERPPCYMVPQAALRSFEGTEVFD